MMQPGLLFGGTAMQPSLFEPLAPIVHPDRDPGWRALSNQERYALFAQKNPHVYRALVASARYLRSRGVKRMGIALLFERLRWQYLETHGDPYLLNNTYRAFYARDIMAREADLADVFETRDSPHDPEFYDKAQRV